MAQTGYTPIQHYYSITGGNTPTTGNLTLGEIAINVADQKVYMLNSASNAVVTLVGTLGNQNSNSVSITGGSINGTTIGATTASTGAFTTISASGVITSTVSTGTAPFTVASTTQVANLNSATAGTATNATNTAITDNTSSSATWYPTIVSATTGNLPQSTSSTKLSFVPSTGTLTATSYAGAWAGSTIGTGYGGTGVTAFGGTNTLLYTTTANTLSSITTANTSTLITNSSGAPSWTSGTTANRVLRTDGTTVSFSQVALATDVSGVLPVANSLLYYNTNIKTISSGSNYDWYSIDFGVYTGHSARVEVVFSLISGGTGSRIWYRNSLVLETGGATLSENNLNAVNGANGTLSFVLSGATLTVRTTTSGTSETARMAILVEGYEMTSSRITVL